MKNSQKNLLYLDFKVAQGHRCWYCWKAHKKCLLW